MKRVFVYEYLSGGGLLDGDGEAIGDLMTMGLAMRDALTADLLQLADCATTVATCSKAPLPDGRAAAAVPESGEPPLDFVARQADRHDCTWVVAPETDGLLEGFCRIVDPARWIGCDAAAIHLATGKRATLMRLAGHGIATPLAFAHVPEVDRWVVKPDDGAGAVATRVHLNQDAAWEDWTLRSRQGVAMTIEPWIAGEPLSLSLLCGSEGAEVLSVNRQHIVVDGDGMLSFEGVEPNVMPPDDPRMRALRALATQVASQLPGLRGFVGIDLVWHAHCGPVLIELNPRVTSAYVGLSASLGRNLAADILQAHAASFHGHD
jgi:predicted ATP-grasp superfamily ATP-dependent carboligase